MPNRLSMAKINSIETLHASGRSNREIARLLDINRKTVNRVRSATQGTFDSKGAKPATEKAKMGQTRKQANNVKSS